MFRPSRRIRLATLGIGAALIIGSLAACSTASAAGSTTSTGGSTARAGGAFGGCTVDTAALTFAIGAHANNAMPGLPSDINAVVNKAVTDTKLHSAGPTLSIVDVDGQPQAAGVATFQFRSTANNPGRLATDQQRFIATFDRAVSGLHAKSPQVDDLSALDLAARTERGLDSSGTVVLIDSGLQTMPPLSFREPGLLDADPGDIVSALDGQIPDLTGLTVLVYGLGDTAAPQTYPDINQHRQLTAIYRAIFRAGHAGCVYIAQQPHSGPAPTDVPPVSLVPMPPPQTIPATPPARFVLQDDGKVGFLPNLAVFRNPTEAAQVLRPLATWLVAGRTRTVDLTGTTARVGTREGQKDLARKRAGAVAAVLRSAGVRPQQITTHGLGSYFPGYVRDHDANGRLLAARASKNRTVIITVTHR